MSTMFGIMMFKSHKDKWYLSRFDYNVPGGVANYVHCYGKWERAEHCYDVLVSFKPSSSFLKTIGALMSALDIDPRAGIDYSYAGLARAKDAVHELVNSQVEEAITEE